MDTRFKKLHEWASTAPSLGGFIFFGFFGQKDPDVKKLFAKKSLE
jgi:hypothetical protein